MKRMVSLGFACSLISLLPALNSKACGSGSGSSSIVPIPTLGGSVFQVNALSQDGQVTGFSWLQGDQAAHAFLFGGGTLTDLGTLGGDVSVGHAINDLGQVVGEADLAGGAETHAFLYTGGSGLLDLGTLGGSYSSATAVNAAGQVAGSALLAGDGEMDAFFYSGGTMTNLSLGGGGSSAIAVNQNGSVAGASLNTNVDYHAFLFSSGQLTDLGTLGQDYSSALALNDSDVVAGESSTDSGETHAFLYTAGAMVDLGTLGGTFSSARAINNLNQVIGVSSTANDAQSHGFVYSGGTLLDFGTLGGTYSSAKAINNLGQVVGYAGRSDGSSHAVLWQNGSLTDLNSLLPANSGWELTSALFINDSGRVVGRGIYQGLNQWFMMDVAAGNTAPVADAGPALNVDCQAQVTLDGTRSSDSDHDPLIFEWSESGQILGTTPVLSISLPVGNHIIGLKVTDPCGASSQTNVLVQVTDTTPPTILSAPSSLTVSVGANCQGTVPNVLAGVVATDNCTPATQLVLSQSPSAGTLLGPGTYSVNVTVTDASGNSASTAVPLTVLDSTPPVIRSVSATPSVISPPNHQMVPVTLAVTASDNCDPAPGAKILSVTCNETAAPGDVQITGPLSLNLAATRNPSGPGRIYSIVVCCTDAGGNFTTATVTVTVPKGGK